MKKPSPACERRLGNSPHGRLGSNRRGSKPRGLLYLGEKAKKPEATATTATPIDGLRSDTIGGFVY